MTEDQPGSHMPTKDDEAPGSHMPAPEVRSPRSNKFCPSCHESLRGRYGFECATCPHCGADATR